ncbi:Twinkle-like protein [Spatholobus suberectus]|nr:Twinkle-like protein [Spatholobus suberectus]
MPASPGQCNWENPEEKSVELQFSILKKLEAVGMETGICVPGQYNHLLCPEFQGGNQEERSLSLYIAPDGGSAVWVCFHTKCGWKGSTQAFAGNSSAASQVTPVKKKR